ncbi:MAG: DUF1045 domain-containing protein [Marinibacterium sp.]|nr:DUF1045 domain-containing protein [Marinibacterium sp.]
MQFARFAIYFVPPQSAGWADWAASWLGWDAITGQARAHPDLDAPLPIADITARPRKYGLHATLKPPMRLAEGRDYDALAQATAALAATQAPVVLDGLELGRLGSFLALVPQGETAALAALAGACVTTLDPFRAPAPDAELARRRAAGLSPAQEAHLTRWGYPYVLDQFRFHITLSGRLGRDQIGAVGDLLDALLTPQIPRPFVIGDIAIAGEDADGRFHVTDRFALTG